MKNRISNKFRTVYHFKIQCFSCKDIRDRGTRDPKLIQKLTDKSFFFDPCPICKCGFARYIETNF